MKPEHLRYLICPACRKALSLSNITNQENGEVLAGTLECNDSCRRRYQIVGGVPRFVSRENYASGFGLEWTKHARTQYDSYSGRPISRNRFFDQTRWPLQMKGETILEAGSGSGRFTEVVAQTGAMVVSFDYSYAVDSNFRTNGHLPNVLIVQADIYHMPFLEGTFDRAFCFGVLQHTPDPQLSLHAITPMLKPGGFLVADIYKKSIGRVLLGTKYYVRPVTSRMKPERLYRLTTRWVNLMWPLANLIRKLPKGYAINWRLLVADYSFLGLTDPLLKEWSYLDTFDMLAPRYDRPARHGEFQSWFKRSPVALDHISVEYTSHGLVGRAQCDVRPSEQK